MLSPSPRSPKLTPSTSVAWIASACRRSCTTSTCCSCAWLRAGVAFQSERPGRASGRASRAGRGRCTRAWGDRRSSAPDGCCRTRDARGGRAFGRAGRSFVYSRRAGRSSFERAGRSLAYERAGRSEPLPYARGTVVVRTRRTVAVVFALPERSLVRGGPDGHRRPRRTASSYERGGRSEPDRAWVDHRTNGPDGRSCTRDAPDGHRSNAPDGCCRTNARDARIVRALRAVVRVLATRRAVIVRARRTVVVVRTRGTVVVRARGAVAVGVRADRARLVATGALRARTSGPSARRTEDSSVGAEAAVSGAAAAGLGRRGRSGSAVAVVERGLLLAVARLEVLGRASAGGLLVLGHGDVLLGCLNVRTALHSSRAASLRRRRTCGTE